MRYKSWTLTDVANDLWLDSFAASNDGLHLATPHDWSIRKRTLRGGLRDGIDLIEVHNGALSFGVLPTRGMGLWRGEYRGNYLGWRSPVAGPVHPQFVNLTDRGGLGWLAGFDELLCRCGLKSNGPPGEDSFSDRNGRLMRSPLTLHGHIANRPAQCVEVRINLDPPFEMCVMGEVTESSLFGSYLRMTATYATAPGSNKLVIHDVVENRAAHATEFQMLYHLNVGSPFLEAGSRFVTPIREMAPLTFRAAEGIDTFDTYVGPTVGFVEQVYAYDLLADTHGKTVGMLYNTAADRGLVVRSDRREQPCFTLWKNTAAIEDGYVTGLEPGTNYPNFKGFERQQGRVPLLPANGRWEAKWSLEVLDSGVAVSRVLAEIATLQAQAPAIVHRSPHGRFSPASR